MRGPRIVRRVLRLNKQIKVGRARVQGMFDVSNVLNDNAVL